MAKLKPFQAIRPSIDKVALVSSKSFEAYTSKELEAKLEFNPFTFLHVINPGYELNQDIHRIERYQLIREKYEEFKDKGIFMKDQLPSYYIYEISDFVNSYCGIIAATSVEDYKNGIIKKHEGTLKKREQLFENYLKSTGFNAEPVLLMFEDDEKFDDLIENIKKNRAEYEFSTTDQKIHRLWLIQNQETIKNIDSIFIGKNLYIADGHHRTASSALLADEMKSENSGHNGTERYNYFMSYLIPKSQVKISEFNRFVKDLNGYSKDEFLDKLNKNFIVESKGSDFFKPLKKHHFSMYLENEFYALILKEDVEIPQTKLSNLDAEILNRTILKPILGIHNLNNDSRIGYTNNKLDSISIKTNVDNGKFKVGFGMYPISIDQMIEIADAKLIMPPKTSFIEPKLRSGLTMYEF